MKKILKIIIGLIVVFLVLLSVLVYNIRPVVDLSDYSVAESSPKEIMGKEIADSIAGMLFEKTKDFPMEFTEEEINSIVTWKYNKIQNEKLEGVYCNIHNGKVTFYVNYRVSSKLTTQVILETVITVEDLDLKIAIVKVKLGKIGIPKSLFLKLIKNKYDNMVVDSKESVISIPLNLPEPITIKDFVVTDNISFKVHISIKTRDDLISVFKYFKLKYDELNYDELKNDELKNDELKYN